MTDSPWDPTTPYYDRHAPELVQRYDQARPTYLEHLKTLLKAPGATALDVGCGTGRDLAALLAAGYDAYGIDASVRMLDEGSAHYRIDRTRLAHGALPDAPAPWHATYDAVLCAAVLHHIADDRLLDSLYRLRSLVAPGGFLMISVPTAYPAGSDGQDAQGRRVHLRPAEQYRFFLERLGMYEVISYEEQDSLRRDDVKWEVMVFGWSGTGELRPIEVMESILWDDTKVTTYKFALLRAIAHLATHRPNLARWEGAERVFLPIGAIADLWIRYYWPFMEDGSRPAVIQGQRGSRADMVFRSSLTRLVKLWRESGGYAGFEVAVNRNDLEPSSADALKSVRQQIRKAIEQPVKYAGNSRTGKGMFHYKKMHVVLPESLWRESALLGRWIEDSLVIRWAEFTTRRHASLSAESVLGRLLQQPDHERDTNRAREAYRPYQRAHALECVWTGSPIGRMHVDHAIPWSLWRSNDLWNLLPVESHANTEKGARLPSRGRVEDRRPAIVRSWEILFEAERDLFLAHAREFTGTTAGSTAGADFGSPMQDLLFTTFKDALEYTAINRGVERW